MVIGILVHSNAIHVVVVTTRITLQQLIFNAVSVADCAWVHICFDLLVTIHFFGIRLQIVLDDEMWIISRDLSSMPNHIGTKGRT